VQSRISCTKSLSNFVQQDPTLLLINVLQPEEECSVVKEVDISPPKLRSSNTPLKPLPTVVHLVPVFKKKAKIQLVMPIHLMIKVVLVLSLLWLLSLLLLELDSVSSNSCKENLLLEVTMSVENQPIFLPNQSTRIFKMLKLKTKNDDAGFSRIWKCILKY